MKREGREKNPKYDDRTACLEGEVDTASVNSTCFPPRVSFVFRLGAKGRVVLKGSPEASE